MKKRFLTFILAIATMLTCIFAFSACGGKVEFKINFVVENEIYATVSTSGNEVISMPENPTKYGYTFDGWYWDEDTWEKPFTANSLLDAPLSSDMKVYAKFNKNHTHEYTSTTTEPTCAKKGLITYACSCGDSYTEEIPATGEHTWDDGKITTEPTCTEKGVKTFTCTVCKTATYTEDVEALKHDEKTHEAKAPTCTEKGWEEYVTCEREGCDYSTYKEISATGVHTWDNGTETKAPTCTKEGVTTYTCTVCKKATKTEPIDKLPHEHAEKWTSNETHHWHECACGDKKDESKHTAGAPATATTPQTCTVCDYILQVETGILFNTLTVNGTNVYGKVSNDTEIFSFINEITVKGDATYVVDVNMSCKDPIESKTVELSVGDNKFYVLEKIGNNVKLFTVTIRRRPMYEVTFNANGGTSVQKQVIEEDYFATEPETTRTGYTFTGWDYDFTQAITQTTKITASWSANKDTKYTVNYYLQNFEDDNYTLHETVEHKGETDTTATAEIKEYAHFTYYSYKSTVSGNINPDGSRVLSVYYTYDSYKIVANNNNAKAGTSTQINGKYKYDKEFTLTTTTNAGYTWLGWYDGEMLACKTEEFTFKVEKAVTYTATWSANKDTKYTVNYYLQNLDDNNYTLHETVEHKGETDTTATAEIKEYTHFTYNASKSVISGNVNGDGSQVLSVYYTRNTYKISMNNPSYGDITNSGTYKYGTQITAMIVANLGYDVIDCGWYGEDELLSTDSSYTFIIDKNISVTANFTVKDEMSNFNFTSTASACSITGIKDKTITEIVVPDYATSISQGAFSGCSSLESITIPFVGKERKTSSDTYQYPFGYIFGTSSYTGGKGVTQYYYGSSTSSTTYSTYYIPTSLKKVTVTGGNILRGAFYSCSSLTSIEIPDSVTSIGSDAFDGCSKVISEYKYAKYLIANGNSYFALLEVTNKNFSSYTIHPNTKIIADSAFSNCSSLTSVVIGDSVISIGERAFYECNSLTSVVISDSVTSIGYRAFYNCSSLTSVVIGDSVTSIRSYVFYNCSSLTSIEIPDSVTSIGYEAFYNCDGLTSIEIPYSVTSIGSYAFAYCHGLTSVVIGDSVTSIGNYAFQSCSSLTSIEVSPNNSAYKSVNGILYTKDGTTLVQYPIGKKDTSFVVPDSVTSIGNYAFSHCNSLRSIEIPGSVTSIGNGAFYDCSRLTSVVIGDSVTSIGRYAFEDCSSLTSIKFNDTSTWYMTTISSDWQNKTGGTYTSVTSPAQNAYNFSYDYDYYSSYWYKL